MLFGSDKTIVVKCLNKGVMRNGFFSSFKLKMSHKKIAHIDIQYDNNTKVNFRDVAVLPTPVDNCAICTRRIEKNTVIVYPNNTEFALSHTILEGLKIIYKI